LINVKYVGAMDFYDGLTTGQVYTVIEETHSQFVVKNDLGGVSRIRKEKFEELD